MPRSGTGIIVARRILFTERLGGGEQDGRRGRPGPLAQILEQVAGPQHGGAIRDDESRGSENRSFIQVVVRRHAMPESAEPVACRD